MSDALTVKLVGMEELQRKLETMPRAIARRLLRDAILSAATLWKDEMKLRAPKLYEDKIGKGGKRYRKAFFLSDTIQVKVAVNGDLEAVAKIGPERKAFYSTFLEFGTKKMRAQPFIRAAYESMKNAVLARFVEEGRKIVEEESGGRE
jgi:HK97 gp10 family phage protein